MGISADGVTLPFPTTDPLPFARCYQLEALEMAIRQNTIVFLDTGSGKTLIAVMLLRSYAYLLRKPSPFLAVFLVPQVVLVSQVVEAHTDLKVGTYWGDMGVDYWDGATWNEQFENHEVLVMTPDILLTCLRHSFLKLDRIKVLIMDECHHAGRKHAYACIMKEFYHRQSCLPGYEVPRIFGMTASPVKTKGGSSEFDYWLKIQELETLMNSKVYTCASDSVLAEFIPFSKPKFKFYDNRVIPSALFAKLGAQLKLLAEKHQVKLKKLDIEKSAADSTSEKINKILAAFNFCLDDLGVWLVLKAAAHLISGCEVDDLSWGKLDLFGEAIVRDFSLDVFKAFSFCIPSDVKWSGGNVVKDNVDAGLITSKVACLIESLLEYRFIHDIRCIIFVERVITAIILPTLLSEVLPKYCSWKTKYIAGSNSGLLNQTRRQQNEIVEEFRKGEVNVIVATSILEEGLDVQSCNLVIRFDPPKTVSSFIQSKGRARMPNSDYLLMVKSGDLKTRSRLANYLSSGEIMRKESLHHASLPCKALESGLRDEEFYQVPSTGALVTLSSSISLLYHYCSRLPSDGYFRPLPRCVIDKDMSICTLYLPKSCPLQTVHAGGNLQIVKQLACLEACKKLHTIGALTDNLVPDIIMEEDNMPKFGAESYDEEHPAYFPSGLVNQLSDESKIQYHCYLIKLSQNFTYDVVAQDIVLAVRTELEADICGMSFELEVDRGALLVNLRNVGEIQLLEYEVIQCKKFQVTLLSVLIHHSVAKLKEMLDAANASNVDYMLLPATCAHPGKCIIDWKTVISSALFSTGKHDCQHLSVSCHRGVRTKHGLVRSCMLENSLVYTPHNDKIYWVTGFFKDRNANSVLKMRDGTDVTYKKYYEARHGIKLRFEGELFLKGRHIFHVQNCLQRCRQRIDRAATSNAWVELPPELCYIIMSPVPINTLYSFSFVPSIMHRLEALLTAADLKRHLDSCAQISAIPTIKVLEALTTKRCEEKFHLESLETLGDSFLKYAVSQELFRTNQSHHEGLLSVRKEKLVCNVSLCKLGCDRKLPGFIRNASFNPKEWMIPGGNSGSLSEHEEPLPGRGKMYVLERRKIKGKTIADVVEALLGAYVSAGGETAGLLFMRWLGINVDFTVGPYEQNFLVNPEKFVNIKSIESLLGYSFRDPSLLVEALTHGSYMLPEIPRCYQRLEFLGDAVLDYLVTIHLYREHPGMSPGVLTDLRSASVNNDCYALSAVKAGLHKHILHASHSLHKHIAEAVENFEKLSCESMFGWECETPFPKVLGDVIESLAGAILVDSGFNKEIVFRSIRPLLGPLVTPESVRLHPVRELNELCQKAGFNMKKPAKSRNEDGTTSVTMEVEAKGEVYRRTATSADKHMSKRVASKELLKFLKENVCGDEKKQIVGTVLYSRS